GVVVVRRRRLDGVEARHGDRRYGGVGRPRDAHVGAALGDGVEAVADRVEPGGAAGGDRLHRAAGAEAFGDDRGEGARLERQVQLRIGRPVVDVPAAAVLADLDVVVFQPGGAADGAAQGDRGAPRVGGGGAEPGLPHRLVGRDRRELDVPVRVLAQVRVEAVLEGIEVALGGYAGAQSRRVEQGDAAGGGAAGCEEVP